MNGQIVEIGEEKILVFAGQVSGVRTLADATLRIQIDTQTMGESENGFLLSLHRKYAGFTLKPSETVTDEVLQISKAMQVSTPEDTKKAKSPSQRLRNIIYVRFQKAGNPGGDFDKFYESAMESYINYESSLIEKL